MILIRWSPQAVSDLEAIRDYIAKDSQRYASLVVARLVTAVDHLKSFPESGRVVPELGDPSIREIFVRPYRIVYRLKSGAVQIATVFRASHRLPDLE